MKKGLVSYPQFKRKKDNEGSFYIGGDQVSLSDTNRNSKAFRKILDGPGKLCKALSLTRAQNGTDLTGEELYVTDSLADVGAEPAPAASVPPVVHTGKRIGIDYAEEAADFPWRFWI